MDPKLLADTIRTVTVILGGLVAGYCLRKAGRLPADFGTRVNRATLTWAQPVVIAIALWSMKPMTGQMLLLPVFGLLMVVLLALPAALTGRLLKLDTPARGTFITSAMFSNVGFTYGTFVAYAALGTPGAALGSLYCASFMPSVFTLGFAVARRYSAEGQCTVGEALRDLVRDSHTRNPVVGILVGLALNLWRVPTPAWTPTVIDLAMPTATAAFLLATGYGLRLSAVRAYWRECLVMQLLRMSLGPLIGALLAVGFGYWSLADRGPLTVVLIMASAPVGIMAALLSDIFGLNRQLAGALWLTTNIAGVLLAPVILVLVRLL